MLRCFLRYSLGNVANNIKYAGQRFLFIYLLLVPFVNEWDFYYWCSKMLISFAAVVTMLFPNTVPKAMYLCPVNQEERKSYLWKGILFKIILCSTLNLVIFISLFLWKKDFSVFYVIYYCFSYSLLTVLFNIMNTGSQVLNYSIKIQTHKKQYDRWVAGKEAFYLGFPAFLCWLGITILNMFEDKRQISSLRMTILTFMFLCALYFSVNYFRLFYMNFIRQCTDYELLYASSSKSDK